MTDEIDRDQAVNERDLETLIARARFKPASSPSSLRCRLCGKHIPEKRRLALPGVSTCTNCQAIAEKRRPAR